MISWLIRKYRAMRREARVAYQQEQYSNGWNWAAGRLLAGAPPEEVSRKADAVLVTPFDRGARDAIMVWLRQGIGRSKGGTL